MTPDIAGRIASDFGPEATKAAQMLAARLADGDGAVSDHLDGGVGVRLRGLPDAGPERDMRVGWLGADGSDFPADRVAAVMRRLPQTLRPAAICSITTQYGGFAEVRWRRSLILAIRRGLWGGGGRIWGKMV